MAKAILLTTLQAAAGFGVTDMSIYTWRAGTATKAKLPVVKGIPGDPKAVRFDAAAMKQYAKEHNLKFDLVAAQAVVVGAGKPGPVPKAEQPAVKAAVAAKKVPTKAATKVAKKVVVPPTKARRQVAAAA